MKKTGFLFDRRYLLHETGPYHPEVPERLDAVYKGIEEAGLLPRLKMISASMAPMKWIETVHDRAYIDRLGDACVAGKRIFDAADNQMRLIGILDFGNKHNEFVTSQARNGV